MRGETNIAAGGMSGAGDVEVETTLDWRLVLDLTDRFADRVLNDEDVALPVNELAQRIKRLVFTPQNEVLRVTCAGEPAGCFIFVEGVDAGIYEVHTLLGENCRGARALAAGRLGLEYIFGTCAATRVHSLCPRCMPETYWYARRLGFTATGLAAQPWVKRGKTFPQRLVELKRKDFLCRYQQQ